MLRIPRFIRSCIGKAESDAALERYGQALALTRAALDVDRKAAGASSAAIARDLESQGLAQQYSGALPSARQSYARALAIRMANQGRLHPKVAQDLNELGTVAYLQDDAAGAERYFRQSLRPRIGAIARGRAR